jgi:pimeloyl-ACP methyl ester carboxylesterase
MQLAGGTIAYSVAGTGPPLMLIHGLGGTRHTWRHLMTALARTHTTIALDLPGHGESDAPAGNYSFGGHACAVRDLLVALGHPRASIAGHSLGGGIALQIAYQFPERTDRLVLVSSGGLGAEVTPILRAATVPGAGALVAGLSRVPAALTRRLFELVPGLVAPSDARLLSDGLRGLRNSRQRKTLIRTARTVIDWRGQTVTAGRLTSLLGDIPVLVAWGADDTTIPPRHHHALAERVPHAVMVEIAGAGHYPHETAADRLLSAIEGFLATTRPFRYSEERWVELLTQPHDDPPGQLAIGRARG